MTNLKIHGKISAYLILGGIKKEIGQRFGKLVVIEVPVIGFTKTGNPYKGAKCRCDCGVVRVYPTTALTRKTKSTTSCGCVAIEKAKGIKVPLPIGEKFGLLTVIADAGTTPGRSAKRLVYCNCDCGEMGLIKVLHSLKIGAIKSCGCLNRKLSAERGTKHGMYNTKVYSVWQAMLQRCNNPRAGGYKDYGGRGITHDPKWSTFEGFWEDMSQGYAEGLTLERFDVNGNYCKDNCSWETFSAQSHNRRKNSTCSSYGKTSKFYGVSFDKERGRWVSRLGKDGKTVLYKRFDSEIEAAMAYDDASEQVYGNRPNKDLLEKIKAT